MQNGEVTLTGTVAYRSAKWELENLIDQIGGVSEIHNQLRMKRDDSTKSDADDKSSKRMNGMSGSSATGSLSHK